MYTARADPVYIVGHNVVAANATQTCPPLFTRARGYKTRVNAHVTLHAKIVKFIKIMPTVCNAQQIFILKADIAH